VFSFFDADCTGQALPFHNAVPVANLQLATGEGSGMAASGVIKRGWLGISI